MTKFNYRHPVTIAGHRGDPKAIPENTLASFKSSIEKGADMVELDVHMTKDGEIIVMHDATVDRTTNGSGRISEMTLAEIRALSAGEYNGQSLQVPTFREFCGLVKPYDVLINVEFKDYFDTHGEEFSHESMVKTVDIIEEFDLSDRVVMNSFDAHVLKKLAEMNGGRYRTHGFYPYSIMRNVESDPTEYLYCACMFDYSPENAQFLKDHGIEVWLGAGVVTKEQFETGIGLGAVLFTTNDTAGALKICEELGVR